MCACRKRWVVLWTAALARFGPGIGTEIREACHPHRSFDPDQARTHRLRVRLSSHNLCRAVERHHVRRDVHLAGVPRSDERRGSRTYQARIAGRAMLMSSPLDGGRDTRHRTARVRAIDSIVRKLMSRSSAKFLCAPLKTRNIFLRRAS